MSRQSEYTGRFEARSPKRERAVRVSAGIAVLLFLVVGCARLGTAAFRLLGYYDLFLGGKGLLRNREVASVEIADSVKTREGISIPIYRMDDGKTIRYQDHTYRLNEDLATVLVMGIDRDISEEEQVIGRGGQCDAILLVGLDTRTGEARVLNINRETYAQVEVFSIGGRYIETRLEQLDLAYAYGDRHESSCENAERAVSRLLYGLPIGSYVSIDMEGILAANEAVGGVTVTSLIDFESGGVSVRKGEKVELHGAAAERYLRVRDRTLDGNRDRMERGRQYLTEFSKLVVKESKNDLSFPVTLFSSLSSNMVTSLTVPDVTFLSSCFIENGAHFSFRTVDGTYGVLNGSAVFYPDEADLFEAVLQIFYIRVD